MDLNTIKIAFNENGKARIRIEDIWYKLVYIGFGENRVVYNYQHKGVTHSIIVSADHFNKLADIDTITEGDLPSVG